MSTKSSSGDQGLLQGLWCEFYAVLQRHTGRGARFASEGTANMLLELNQERQLTRNKRVR